jgi:hypothetical protein
MSKQSKQLVRLLWSIPLLSVMTLWSTFVCFSTGAVAMMQLAALGVPQKLVLILGLLVGGGTIFFIWFFQKIKDLIMKDKESIK